MEQRGEQEEGDEQEGDSEVDDWDDADEDGDPGDDSSQPRQSARRNWADAPPTNYKVFTTSHDEIVTADELCDVEELERLRTEFIKVNYAKAADMAELLKQTDNAILSPRGSVSVDERTNTLLVKDTNSSLLNVRTLMTSARNWVCVSV